MFVCLFVVVVVACFGFYQLLYIFGFYQLLYISCDNSKHKQAKDVTSLVATVTKKQIIILQLSFNSSTFLLKHYSCES